MLFTTLLLTAAAFLTSAAPVPQFDPPPPDTKFFKLKAVTTAPFGDASLNDRYNNTYVETYHTGAGLNAMTIGGNATYSGTGFLNGTVAQFNFSGAIGYSPYGLIMEDDPYATWSPALINAGYGTEYGAFYFNQTAGGSLWFNTPGNSTDPYYESAQNGFQTWLACDWVYPNVAQVFWLNSYYARYTPHIPANCAPINLIPDYDAAST